MTPACSATPSASPEPDQPLRFGYVGTLTGQYDNDAFWAGWELARREPELAGATAHVYGHLGFFGGVTPRHGLPDASTAGVAYHGPVAKADLGEVYRDLDVLLFLVPDSPYVTSGKTYEYMATGKPIVAVHRPDSAAAVPLSGYPLKVTVTGMTPEAVRDALIQAAALARRATKLDYDDAVGVRAPLRPQPAPAGVRRRAAPDRDRRRNPMTTDALTLPIEQPLLGADALLVVTPWYPAPATPTPVPSCCRPCAAPAPHYPEITVLHVQNVAADADRPPSWEHTPEGPVLRVRVPTPDSTSRVGMMRLQHEAMRTHALDLIRSASVVHCHVGAPTGASLADLLAPSTRLVLTEHASYLPQVLRMPEARELYQAAAARGGGDRGRRAHRRRHRVRRPWAGGAGGRGAQTGPAGYLRRRDLTCR